MSRWIDQQQVTESEALCHFYMGDGLSVEIESILIPNPIELTLAPVHIKEYRLTVGSLFASESVRYPHTQQGLEDLLKTLAQTRNADGPTKPIGGTLEPREHHNDDSD